MDLAYARDDLGKSHAQTLNLEISGTMKENEIVADITTGIYGYHKLHDPLSKRFVDPTRSGPGEPGTHARLTIYEPRILTGGFPTPIGPLN